MQLNLKLFGARSVHHTFVHLLDKSVFWPVIVNDIILNWFVICIKGETNENKYDTYDLDFIHFSVILMFAHWYPDVKHLTYNNFIQIGQRNVRKAIMIYFLLFVCLCRKRTFFGFIVSASFWFLNRMRKNVFNTHYVLWLACGNILNFISCWWYIPLPQYCFCFGKLKEISRQNSSLLWNIKKAKNNHLPVNGLLFTSNKIINMGWFP